jgi:alanine racemase
MTTYPTTQYVDLQKYKRNLQLVEAASGTNLIVILKANAYGLGAFKLAEAAIEVGIFNFATAFPKEALDLRQHFNENYPDKKLNIIALLSSNSADTYKTMIENNIEVSVGTISSIHTFLAANNENLHQNSIPKVHLELDTGMSRGGILPSELGDAIKLLNETGLELSGIWSHFADSEVPSSAYTASQKQVFLNAINLICDADLHFNSVHFENSGALINSVFGKSQQEFDQYLPGIKAMARTGIIQLGYNPDQNLENVKNLDCNVSPIVSLKSKLASIKKIEKGSKISYNGIYQASEDIMVGIVPVGYADGISRKLSADNAKVSDDIAYKVLIKYNYNGIDEEAFCPIIGRICMDQFMIKLPNIFNDLSINNVTEVVLIDDSITELSLNNFAAHSDTINYEILTNLNGRINVTYL